ncbi:MAG: glycosyl transferase family 2 [Actinomycetia bacterium]|nr:glycosyl transferase family 2 [Actinomycetes bacterium]
MISIEPGHQQMEPSQVTTHSTMSDVQRSPLDEKSDVSVVLPYFKSEAFVRETIDSILAQDCKVREIVVIDDGTPYDSADEALAPYPFLTRARQENQGPGAARQAGFLLTTAPYVCFLDCDDRIAPGGLTLLRDALVEHPEWGMVSGRAMVIDEEGVPTGAMMLPQPETDDLYGELLERTYICPPGSVLFRSTVLEKVGGWRNVANHWGVEDYDVYLRIARNGPIGCVQDVVNEYRRHPGSQGQDSERLLESIVNVLEDERQYTTLDWQREQSRLAGLAYWKTEFSVRHREHAMRKAWQSKQRLRAVGLAIALVVRFPLRLTTSVAHRVKAKVAKRNGPDPEPEINPAIK